MAEEALGWKSDEKISKFYADGLLVDALGKGLAGTATIPSGGTSITCTHGLGAVPKVFLGLKTNLATRSAWTSSETATDFIINISSSAGTGGVLFNWHVKP